MRGRRFREEQIIGALREQWLGRALEGSCECCQ